MRNYLSPKIIQKEPENWSWNKLKNPSPDLESVEYIGFFIPDNINESDNFGSSMSLNSSGTTIAVGSKNKNGSLVDNCGAVYVFDKIDSDFVQREFIQPENLEENEFFGSSVSLYGSVGDEEGPQEMIAIGAPGKNQETGYVYILSSVGGSSFVSAGSIEPDLFPGLKLGYSLSYSPNQIGVDFTLSLLGIFGFEGVGVQTYYELLTQLVGENVGDFFGMSSSISNNGLVVAVGAPKYNNSGCVYIYDLADNELILRYKLESESMEADQYFGSSVSLNSDGSTLFVGSEAFINPGGSIGRVQIYKWDGESYYLAHTIINPDVSGDGYFGSSVSTDSTGIMFCVGARKQTVETKLNAGKVFVYEIMN